MPPELLQRRSDALIERCYAGLDAATLRREVAARLKAAAGVDAAFIATVDPATLLFTSAISEEPLIPASGWTVPGVRPAACSFDCAGQLTAIGWIEGESRLAEQLRDRVLAAPRTQPASPTART